MMTYGGNMNGFDEASFLMQSSGMEGGALVYLCVCVGRIASWHRVISADSPLLAEKLPVHVVCLHTQRACIASQCPFESTQ